MNMFLTRVESPQRAWLEGEEARHCFKVFRHQPGDEVLATDGQGQAYRASILSASADKVALQILETLPGYGEPPVHIHLAFSPLRLADRQEWLVEKAVELGASQLTPIYWQHTDKYKATVKVPRLENIIRAATKQSMRSRIPALNPAVAADVFLQQINPAAATCLLAQADQPLPIMQAGWKPEKPIILAIGPEGDFSQAEIDLALAKGWQGVHLGQLRLRAETAAVFAMSALKLGAGY